MKVFCLLCCLICSGLAFAGGGPPSATNYCGQTFNPTSQPNEFGTGQCEVNQITTTGLTNTPTYICNTDCTLYCDGNKWTLYPSDSGVLCTY